MAFWYFCWVLRILFVPIIQIYWWFYSEYVHKFLQENPDVPKNETQIIVFTEYRIASVIYPWGIGYPFLSVLRNKNGWIYLHSFENEFKSEFKIHGKLKLYVLKNGQLEALNLSREFYKKLRQVLKASEMPGMIDCSRFSCWIKRDRDSAFVNHNKFDKFWKIENSDYVVEDVVILYRRIPNTLDNDISVEHWGICIKIGGDEDLFLQKLGFSGSIVVSDMKTMIHNYPKTPKFAKLIKL
jgi:hypothetical protein